MLCSMRYPAFFETGPSIQCSWGKFTNEIAADRKGPEFRQGMQSQARPVLLVLIPACRLVHRP